MSRLTIRAEEEGVKAIWYGERDVFLEGEIGYAEADKLAHYEDLAELGRLIELPCKVGDTVYSIHSAGLSHAVITEVYTDAFCLMLCVAEGRFGKTVFLTKEEAESKLKELEGAE